VATRAVFDTNVLLSALFSLTGPPFRCLALARTGAVESVTCQAILDEFVEKLIDKFGFDPERAQQAAQEVRDLSQMMTVPGQLKVVVADPDDDVIIRPTVSIVSGPVAAHFADRYTPILQNGA
jgi:predicted nucleic acid-binding protein